MNLYLRLNAIAFLAFGLAAVLVPTSFADVLGSQFGVVGLVDFVAVYGGLSLGLA